MSKKHPVKHKETEKLKFQSLKDRVSGCAPQVAGVYRQKGIPTATSSGETIYQYSGCMILNGILWLLTHWLRNFCGMAPRKQQPLDANRWRRGFSRSLRRCGSGRSRPIRHPILPVSMGPAYASRDGWVILTIFQNVFSVQSSSHMEGLGSQVRRSSLVAVVAHASPRSCGSLAQAAQAELALLKGWAAWWWWKAALKRKRVQPL